MSIHPWDVEGGPAFPVAVKDDVEFKGMSLRDWFAGQALMGFMACRDGPSDRSVTARFCFEYADAMLAARKTEAS